MQTMFRSAVLAALVLLISTGAARAQSVPAASSSTQDEGWRFTIYPVLAWLPYNINIDVNLPGNGGGGGGGGGGEEASILNSHFDGAFLAGFCATNGTWRVDTDGLWAAVGGDREPRLPNLSVDVDVYYGHATIGRHLGNDFYVTAGVRRFALKYDVTLANLAPFTRKPGVWDPLVGLAWHREGKHLEWHGVFEGGGFGVGSDVDLGASFRLDWKPVTHFGLTGGYSLLYFKVSQDVANQTFIAKNTFSGPLVGIGLYF
jgi:hypothetical protein